MGGAIALADETYVYDNTSASRPFRVVAHYKADEPVIEPMWPGWAPWGNVAAGSGNVGESSPFRLAALGFTSAIDVLSRSAIDCGYQSINTYLCVPHSTCRTTS